MKMFRAFMGVCVEYCHVFLVFLAVLANVCTYHVHVKAMRALKACFEQCGHQKPLVQKHYHASFL